MVKAYQSPKYAQSNLVTETRPSKPEDLPDVDAFRRKIPSSSEPV